MQFPELYFQYLFIIPVLWMMVIAIHGLMKTEADSLGDGSAFIKNAALGSLMMVLFFWSLALITPILIGWNRISLSVANVLMELVWTVVIWLLIVNILTGIVNHLILRNYSLSKWGTTRPLYGDWGPYRENSNRESTHTTIWFNSSSWSPVHSSTNASLSSRAKGKAHRASTSTAYGPSHRTQVFPLFLSAPSRGKSFKMGTSHRTRGSSKSSSGGGLGKLIAYLLTAAAAALKAIIAFLVQLIAILLLAAVAVFFAWFAYWFTQRVSDRFDEIWAINLAAEEV